MSRKFLPIAGAAVIALLIVVNAKHRDGKVDDGVTIDKDNDDDSKRDRRKKKHGAASQYALDAQRVDWPPLDDGTIGETTTSTHAAVNTTNYYVVLDGSGSMLSKRCGGGSTKIEAAVTAVKHFFVSVPAEANIGLAAFDRNSISERVPLGVDNREALRAALDKISAGSDTPLLSSIKIGYEKLTAQARTQLGYGEYHLVVVTDGQPDPDNEDPKPIVRKILEQSPVVLHTIGFCIDSNHVLNQPKKTFYASATDPAELAKSLQAVLAEAPAFDATKF